MLSFLVSLGKAEYVDIYGVEFSDQNLEILTSTSSYIVDYVVPYQCKIIQGGNSFDESAFRGCKDNIRTLSFEENSELTCIYPYAFSTTSIEELNLSNCNKLGYINTSICHYCYKLKILTLPDGITEINTSAFHYCMSLQAVTIPNSVITIRPFAFSYCESIKKITISVESKLENIYGDAFTFVKESSFFIPKNMKIYEGACFWHSSISHIAIDSTNTYFSVDENDQILFDFGKTILYYAPMSLSGEYTLPDTVTSIYPSALRDTGITKLNVNTNNQITIQSWALGGCLQLSTFTITKGNKILYNNLFNGCINLKSISLPDSLMEIHEKAFYNCINLQSINIPNQVSMIKGQVFYNCTSLKTVNLPSSLNSLAEGVFTYCPRDIQIDCSQIYPKYQFIDKMLIYNNNQINEYFGELEELQIPQDITVIGARAFVNSNIHTITFNNPTSLKIGDYAFSCVPLESITFPNTLTYIGIYAFENCSNIQDIDISQTKINQLSKYSFYGCSQLTTFKIPNTLLTICEYAFAYCKSLQSFDFKSSKIEKIEGRAFLNTGLKTIEFSSCLKELGVSSFDTCTANKISLQQTSINLIPILCFANCYELKELTFANTIIEIGDQSFQYCTKLTTFTLPKNIKSINTQAFYGCIELENVTLYLNCELETVKGQAFANCPKLLEFQTDPQETKFIFKEGVLLDSEETIIYVYLPSSKSKIYVVPSKVTRIQEYAFQQCNNLEEVIIPDGTLTYIGLLAFEGCAKLRYLYLPSTLETVGMQAFFNCKSLGCGSVYVKSDEIRELVVNRGISRSVFQDECPKTIISCKQNSPYFNKILFTFIFLQIYKK